MPSESTSDPSKTNLPKQQTTKPLWPDDHDPDMDLDSGSHGQAMRRSQAKNNRRDGRQNNKPRMS